MKKFTPQEIIVKFVNHLHNTHGVPEDIYYEFIANKDRDNILLMGLTHKDFIKQLKKEMIQND